ncbi:MAG: polymerase, sigma subunit, family [Bacillota bacterium]|jgi:RNA polymerase sigma-70 factor (ECF subfamily)|nr:polymerase, sigma subunit, family [Bacillota bacterium]
MTAAEIEAFDALYKENLNKVYHFALALTGNAADAEEITQEAFFKALQGFPSFRHESSFFTWIYRITLNVASSYLKERSKMPVLALTEDYGYKMEDIYDEHPCSNPERLYLAKEAKYKCLHCLTECLSGEQRQIFCLNITLGLPQKQVAEILGCSLSKVKTTIHRAKQQWFGYMENRCSLIKKSNPCRCEQWVRFGLQQGWIVREERDTKRPEPHHPEEEYQVITEIRKLKGLRLLYKSLYPQNPDDAFSERIREGIRRKEWSIIS